MQIFNKGAFLDHLSHEPMIMGVVNVTPDSFSDGGQFYNADKAIEHGLRLLQEGVHILDVGGESTRPGADIVDIDEEIQRVVPVVKALREAGAQWVSIDTRNAATMRSALEVGANIINDISALSYDPESLEVVAAAKVPVILMHSQGTPQDMQDNPNYNNVVEDVFDYLKSRIEACKAHRIETDLLIVDPGIGFGKTVEHNMLLLRNIKIFQDLGVSVLLGTSRKSFIAKLSNNEPADERLAGSLSSALWGLSQGVKIFRVHDVKETRQAFRIYDAISSADAIGV